MNKSQRIRDYATANPTATAKEVSTALDMKPNYVYAVLWALKQRGRIGKTGPKKTRPTPKKYQVTHISTSDNSIEVAIAKEMSVTMEEPKHDPVNHPAHYKYGGIETIDFIEAKELGYNLGNVVKYVTRSDHKGNRKEDLEKALWYLTREINSIK